MLPSQTDTKNSITVITILLYRSAQSGIPDFVSVELLQQYFSQRDNDLKDKNNKSILKGSLSGVISHLETTKR